MITRGTSKGQLIPLVFGQDALAASQTDVQLPVTMAEATQAVTGYTMPFRGQIAGVSVATSAAATAGTLTAGATINGTEVAASTVTVTTETSDYVRVRRGSGEFAAGASIGAEITTSGTWDGIAADLVVIVWVLAEIEGI